MDTMTWAVLMRDTDPYVSADESVSVIEFRQIVGMPDLHGSQESATAVVEVRYMQQYLKSI